MFYVYEYFIVETNEVFYVGKGTGKRACELHNRSKFFKSIFNKYTCAVRFVCEQLTNEEACKLEIKHIARMKNIGQAKCNFTLGGTGFSHGLLNPNRLNPPIGERNPMYGVKLMGEKNGFYGRRHTKESKQKMSDSKRGKPGLSGKDNPMYGKGFKGEDNPMFGVTGVKHHNSKAYKATYTDGTSEVLHAKGCEKKFGIAFERIRHTGGTLSYKKKTPNSIYEGTLLELMEPVTTIATASTPKWVETGSTEK